MISFEVALLAWIPVSALLMMDPNRARGFSFAVILGLMLLPEAREIELPGVPDIGKSNVPFLGVLIGTIIFHPRSFDRFTLLAIDFTALVSLFATFVTAFINDHAMTYALSRVFTLFIGVILPILLARIHIGTPHGIRTFMLWLIAASVVYVPLAVWEFRMSPQLHTQLYGYFQHVFQQHFRGGYWRPVVFFPHALPLARFFAFAAFLALFPLRKDLERIFGWPGRFVFLAPLLGLLASQSYGPFLALALLVTGYYLLDRWPWAVFVPPVLAYAWLAAVFSGMRPGFEVVERIETVNVDRAQSLAYRFHALEEYSEIILARPGFGFAGFGEGRTGRATDSQVIINLIDRGFVGTGLYLAWWFFVLYACYNLCQSTRGTPFHRRARAVSALVGMALAIITIDAAIDTYVLVLGAAMLSVYAALRGRNPLLPAPPALQPAGDPDRAHA